MINARELQELSKKVTDKFGIDCVATKIVATCVSILIYAVLFGCLYHA